VPGIIEPGIIIRDLPALKLFVAMSGGVDSSVAALLLKRAGHEVIGVHLRTGVQGGPGDASGKPRCCGADEADDARRTAALLGIPFYVQNAESDFGGIIADFVDSYARGETPNPCVACNSRVKFGSLLARARALGAEGVATGHYARRVEHRGRPAIARGRDAGKDQSYVLYRLTPEEAAHAWFPLGELTKREVRALAREAGLPAADKPESQEICFVPSGDYRDLLRERRPSSFEPGEIVDGDGRRLGRHEGIAGFTVGQRRGLGLGTPEPAYVLALEPESRRVVVGPKQALGVRSARLRAPLFHGFEAGETPRRVEAVLRYRAAPKAATVHLADPGEAILRFDDPAWPVSPGQAAVLYEGDVVVGGGTIRAGS